MKVTAVPRDASTLRKDAPEAAAAEHSPWTGPGAVVHDTEKTPCVHLTPRQLEVLRLLCEGLPNKLICRRLNIAAGTVKVHIGVILRELGVTSRLQAVVAAHRCGILGEVTVGMPERAAGSAASAHSTIPARPARSAFHSLAVAC